MDEGPKTARTRLSEAKAYSQGLVSEIMREFDPALMRKVRREFDRIGDGEVNLNQFVRIMQTHLPHLNKGDLKELFLEIDVNGDGTMEWDELTAFFVEKSSVYEESKQDNYAVPYRYIEDTELGSIQDEAEIQKIKYIDQLDVFAVLKSHVKAIRLYDARDVSSEIGRLTGSSGFPICAEYIPNGPSQGSRIQPGRLITSSSNLTLSLWQLAPGEHQFSVQSCWPVPHAQAALCWIDKYRMLYSASVVGILHLWDVDKRMETACITDAHHDIASSLTYLDELDCMASGGMDATIYIWDVHACAKRQKLVGHDNGVYTMAYNQSHRVLVSGGIDHDAFVWSPFSSSAIYKLRGHNDSIAEIQNVPGSEHQIVSGDVGGTLKLWDVRKFQCLQTFTVEAPHSLQGMTSFAIARGFDIQKHVGCDAGNEQANAICSSNRPPYISRIVAGTKNMHMFDQCDPVLDMVSDDIPIIAVCINSVSMTIITATGRSVKIWDLLTGKQLRKYEGLTTSDTTAMCLDDRQRKFLLGDHSGRIHVYNYSSGAFMKSLDSHKAEVSKLLYCEGHKFVISVSWDRQVVVHSELEAEHGVRLREMDTLLSHREDVTCADYSGTHVLTGSLDKTVRLWDFFSGKLCNKLTCEADLTTVLFLPEVEGICASDRSGRVYFWKMPLSLDDEKKNSLVYSNLRQCPQSKEGEKSSILAMAWDPQSKQLLTGDEYGSLRTHFVDESLALQSAWHLAKAHEDGITCIDIAPVFNLVLTSSYDCCVRAFSLKDGTSWGVLVNGAGRGLTRSPFWNVPFEESTLQSFIEEEGTGCDKALQEQKQSDACENGEDANAESKLERQSTVHLSGRLKSVSSRRLRTTMLQQEEKVGELPETGSRGDEEKEEGETEDIVFRESKERNDNVDAKAERRKLIHKLISLPF